MSPVCPDLRGRSARENADESLAASLSTAGPGRDPVTGRATDPAPDDLARAHAIARGGAWALLEVADAIRELADAVRAR